MECLNCGHQNPPKGNYDSRCNECGHLLLGTKSQKLAFRETTKNPVQASILERIINYVLDLFLFAFIFGPSIGAVINALVVYVEEFAPALKYIGIHIFLRLLQASLLFLYYVLPEYFFQKTPAKFLTRTRVVRVDGSKPSLKLIICRTIFRVVPFEAFSVAGSDQFDGPNWWHDRWSKTRVINDKQ